MSTIAQLKQQQADITEQLQQRQAKATTLSTKIEAARKQLSALESELSAILGTEAPKAQRKKAVKAPKKVSSRKPADARKGPSQRQMVTEILREAGKAMSLGELVAAMKGRGYQFKSKDPKGALGVTLYTAKPQIKAVGGGRFKLGASGVKKK